MSYNKFTELKIILSQSILAIDSQKIILQYYWQLLKKRKVLLNWINPSKLNWNYL